MNDIRRVFFLSGARSEYDLMAPVVAACQKRPELAPAMVAGASLLSPFHGSVVKEIEKDGFDIAARLETLLASETPAARGLSFGNLHNAMVLLLERDRPDIVFVAGDREEALAGALAANFTGVPVAHLHGGDRCLASDIDEVFRPAISKLAHLHFVANQAHQDRLIKMGERPETVFNCGAPGLDRLLDEPETPAEELKAAYGVDPEQPYFLLIFHPAPMLGTDQSGQEMSEVLKGILDLGHPVLCSYPNTDPGNMAMRVVIDQFREANDNLLVYHHLPRSHFVTLYRHCAAMVGNSSSLVIESGFLRVPAVMIGRRQELRETGQNVIPVPVVAAEIQKACKRTLKDEDYLRIVQTAPSVYGDGKSSPRIAKVLAEVELNQDLLLKTITY